MSVAPPVAAESTAVFVAVWSLESPFFSSAVSEKLTSPDWSCDFKLSKNELAALLADSILERISGI